MLCFVQCISSCLYNKDGTNRIFDNPQHIKNVVQMIREGVGFITISYKMAYFDTKTYYFIIKIPLISFSVIVTIYIIELVNALMILFEIFWTFMNQKVMEGI